MLFDLLRLTDGTGRRLTSEVRAVDGRCGAGGEFHSSRSSALIVLVVAITCTNEGASEQVKRRQQAGDHHPSLPVDLPPVYYTYSY